jgi:hypothetical protein
MMRDLDMSGHDPRFVSVRDNVISRPGFPILDFFIYAARSTLPHVTQLTLVLTTPTPPHSLHFHFHNASPRGPLVPHARVSAHGNAGAPRTEVWRVQTDLRPAVLLSRAEDGPGGSAVSCGGRFAAEASGRCWD